MKQVLRKQLKHTIEGNIETNVFERIEKEILTDQEMQELIDIFGDDCESAYDCYGLMFDFDDDLAGVNLDKLAGGLQDYLSEQDEDNKNEVLEGILKKVEPLHQYSLDFETEDKKKEVGKDG